METFSLMDFHSALLLLGSHGQNAERQWRPRRPSGRLQLSGLGATGRTPKGNGDQLCIEFFCATCFRGATGRTPKGNGDQKTFLSFHIYPLREPRAERRKAMETVQIHEVIRASAPGATGRTPKGNGDICMPGHAIEQPTGGSHGQNAERQWRPGGSDGGREHG